MIDKSESVNWSNVWWILGADHLIFEGVMGDLRKKIHASWFREEKSMQINSREKNILRWKKYRSWPITLQKILHRYMSEKKCLTPERFGKKFKTRVLHFKIENTPIRHKWKEKVQKMLKRKLFAMKFLSRNSTLFSTPRIGSLGLFWTNQGSEVSEDTWGTFRTLWSKKSAFLKRNFCIYKGFMDVFYILTSAWKKNHKMCIWNWFFFYHVLDRFNLRERNDLTCLTRIAF